MRSQGIWDFIQPKSQSSSSRLVEQSDTNRQMDLGRVNSELNLSQRETDEKNRLLQVVIISILIMLMVVIIIILIIMMVVILIILIMLFMWFMLIMFDVMTINLITIVENQETLSELATLRSTLADSDEVNVSIKYISYHL